MGTVELLTFVTWIGVAASVLASLGWVVPLWFRLRFVTRAETLRDETMDQVLDGVLPACDAVYDFVRVQDLFVVYSKQLSLWRLALNTLSLQRVDALGKGIKPSFHELTPAQRKIMHNLEARSEDNLSSFIIHSDPLAWTITVVYHIVRLRRPRKMTDVDAKRVVSNTNNEMWAMATGKAMRPVRRRDRHRGGGTRLGPPMLSGR